MPPECRHQQGGQDKGVLSCDGRRSDGVQTYWGATGHGPKTDISHFFWTHGLIGLKLLLTQVSADRMGLRRRTASSTGQDCSMYTTLQWHFMRQIGQLFPARIVNVLKATACFKNGILSMKTIQFKEYFWKIIIATSLPHQVGVLFNVADTLQMTSILYQNTNILSKES